MTVIYSFIILTFHQPRPKSITPFLTTLTFYVCFSNIYKFKFTSFLILSASGDSYKLLQRQKIWEIKLYQVQKQIRLGGDLC